MIDTHCHLDRVRDLAAALDNELAAMVTVGTDASRSEGAVRLAEEQPRVWATVGLHPNDAVGWRDREVRDRIEALSGHPRVVAIGETGVDLFREGAPLADQLSAFDWQAELARGAGKPLVLHVRDPAGSDDASREVALRLREIGSVGGVLHCTNAHPRLLEVALARGWYVSFAGNLTYPSARDLREAARALPAERLLVETDSPFLSPVPNRGKPNVPGNVEHTARALAGLRDDDPRRLESVLDENAILLYRLPLPAEADAGRRPPARS